MSRPSKAEHPGREEKSSLFTVSPTCPGVRSGPSVSRETGTVRIGDRGMTSSSHPKRRCRTPSVSFLL